ncbi:MAG TPA: hypothetical protein VFP50_01905, partial [Anaeromyxobacteraceae bacterium]|nr:hypothetical protein [Anaeromyxobacteraceae bacterium]
GPVAGPAYVVLLDQTTRQARITRYAAPTFPLAYSVAGVPAGSWVLGLIVDVNDDGVFGPGDLNTLSNGPSGGPFIPVAGDLTAQDATFTRANATASAIVSHSVSGTSEAWDLYLAVASGARQPATATASSGPDVSPPVDLGVATDGGGGGSYVLTAARSLGAVPPSFGTYLLDVGYVDGGAEQLSASVSAANLLTPAVLISPTGGASAAPQPTFAWAEPIPAPPAPYTYRLSLRQAGGGRVWETDDFAPAAACAGATCQVAYGFDGRASWPSLPPGDYQWELSVRDAAQDQAWTSAGFHVPVDVTVSPTAPALYPGESTLLTATVTGTGSVTWATTCGTVTPRADPKQADYVAPAAGPCAVTATSTEEPTRLATATITVKPVSIAVTPAALTLEAGQVQVLTAAVTGTGSVTWSASCGALAPLADPLAVRYTAPAAGPCTVTATSDLQPWQSAAAAVTVTATPQLQLDPVTAVLNPGQTQPFVAKLGGAVQPATFTVVEPSGGVIGADGLYVAPAAAGLYHVVAADGSGRTASAVVQVVSAAASPQAVVTITPPAASVVQQGSLGFSATVQGCPGPGPADLSVSWTLRETGTTGSVNPTSPNAATFQAPWSPGVYHVVARAACDPTKTAVAAVTVDLPTVSGTVSWAGTGTGTGRIFVALVTSWGEVVSGTSLAAPGPFTLRGVQQTGALTLRAWRDTLGVETFQRGLEPFAELPVTVPAGGSLSGVTVPLADVTPPAPPAPSSVNAFPGDGRAVVMVQRVQDASGNPLADGYHLRCDTVPASGTPVLLDGTLADDQAFILKGANGTTWTCDGWATAAGQASPTVTSAPFTLGAPVGGQTVTGTVTVDGPAPAGPLYVVLFDPAGAIFTQRIDAPVFPATFAIAGVPNGAYQLGAILDRDDDGVLSRTDPMSFRGGANPIVTVTGAPVAGADVALGVADAQVIAATSHSTGSWGEAYDLAVEVRSGVRVPRQAAVVGGPGIWPPVDLGIESNGGGGDTDVRLRTRFWLGAVRPVVGATYSIEVTWDDGTVTTLPATVTAVLDPPTPVAPVDPLTPAITAPAVPVFSWAAPAALPATPYTYSVYVYQGASWNLWDLPSTQLSATYGTVQPGAPAANPPTLPAGTYRWVAAIQDASGNYASSEATFTVSP